MSKSKVLFINTDVMPYLPESRMAKLGRQLPQGIQDIVGRTELRGIAERMMHIMADNITGSLVQAFDLKVTERHHLPYV